MLFTVLVIFTLPFVCIMAPLLMPGPRSLIACGIVIGAAITWGLNAYVRSGDDVPGDLAGVILVGCIAPLLLGVSIRSAFLGRVMRGRRVRSSRADAT